jgi:hypothetical protein
LQWILVIFRLVKLSARGISSQANTRLAIVITRITLLARIYDTARTNSDGFSVIDGSVEDKGCFFTRNGCLWESKGLGDEEGDEEG